MSPKEAQVNQKSMIDQAEAALKALEDLYKRLHLEDAHQPLLATIQTMIAQANEVIDILGMTLVNGYYIRARYSGARGFTVCATKRYALNELKWFMHQREAIEWANAQKPGQSTLKPGVIKALKGGNYAT